MNLNLNIVEDNVYWIIRCKIRGKYYNFNISSQIFLGDYRLAYDAVFKAYQKFFYPTFDTDEETIERAKLFIIEETISLLKSGILPKEKYFINHFSKKLFQRYYVLDDYRVLKVPKSIILVNSQNLWSINILSNGEKIGTVEVKISSDIIKSLALAIKIYNIVYATNKELTIFQF